MPRLLHLDSSADLETSVSRELTRLFVDTWRELGPGHTVVERDLHRSPLPHLPDAGLHYAPQLRTDSERPDPAAEGLQAELIGELTAADAVVIGAPMYNSSMPSTLKAWIDFVHVVGTTVPVDGSEKPLAGKPVTIVSTRGNNYAPGTPAASGDFVVPPLRQVLGDSLGMSVSVVTVDLTLANRLPPLAPFVAQAAESLAAARVAVRDLATTLGS